MDEGHAACNMQHNSSQILDLMHHNEGNIRLGDFLNANIKTCHYKFSIVSKRSAMAMGTLGFSQVRLQSSHSNLYPS